MMKKKLEDNIDAANRAKARKQLVDEGDFDASDVMIRFESNPEAESNFNDALSKELNISKYGDKGYLIDGEIAQKGFTYFPSHDAGEFAPEIKQAMNAIGEEGETAEAELEGATAAADAEQKEAEAAPAAAK